MILKRKTRPLSVAKQYIVDRVAIDCNGCWIWTKALCGSRATHMNGAAWFNGRQVLAHRLSYEAFNGIIPEGIYVRHTCDNGLCVNPDHLVLGNHLDNMRDMTDRGRQDRGINRHSAVLSESDVLHIYYSPETHCNLASMYGVHRSTIQNIKYGKKWNHITGHRHASTS